MNSRNRKLFSRRQAVAVGVGSVGMVVAAACGGASTPSPTPERPPPTSTTAPVATRQPTAPVAPATAAPPAVPTNAPSPVPPASKGPAVLNSPDYSAHVFLWGSFRSSQRDLNLVREMGFTWVKQMLEWRYIEPHIKGKYEWNEPDRIMNAVADANLKMIARIDNQPKWARSDATWPTPGPPDKLSDFGDFINDLSKRYKGRIHAYQIWNEPNLAREWGEQPPNPVQYAEMLKIAYQAIKANDPDAYVITGGLSPTTTAGKQAMPHIEFAKGLYAAGARPYFDMLGVHAAGFKAPPETGPDEIAKNPAFNNGEGAAGRIYGFRSAEDMRAVMVANGDESKKVAILEFGWTSDPRPSSPYNWHSVSEEEKATYIVGAFEYARKNWAPWVGPMNVIYIADPNWTKENEQYYWSITDPDGKPRPAYLALKALNKDNLAPTGNAAAGTKPPGSAPAAPKTATGSTTAPATTKPAAAKPTAAGATKP